MKRNVAAAHHALENVIARSSVFGQNVRPDGEGNSDNDREEMNDSENNTLAAQQLFQDIDAERRSVKKKSCHHKEAYDHNNGCAERNNKTQGSCFREEGYSCGRRGVSHPSNNPNNGRGAQGQKVAVVP